MSHYNTRKRALRNNTSLDQFFSSQEKELHEPPRKRQKVSAIPNTVDRQTETEVSDEDFDIPVCSSSDDDDNVINSMSSDDDDDIIDCSTSDDDDDLFCRNDESIASDWMDILQRHLI